MPDVNKLISGYEADLARRADASDALRKASDAAARADSRARESAEALSQYLQANGPACVVQFDADGVTPKTIKRYAYMRGDPGISVATEKIVAGK